ncbi:NAD(P)H-quinone oxidoreductase [Sphingobacterium sp. Mn56C]|uniref:NAD(P)H-quinone oxidoreductase n=1 Tax=Sphingobacterium sp. Mn56C TaxID=3395261 RepID=UPI003BD3F745
MRAIVLEKFGGPEVLTTQERPVPVITAGQVLVRVVAAGINRPDVLQRLGKYPAPAGAVQDILGLELSGVVEQCGAAVLGLRPGDRVMALVAGGAYAEYVAVDFGSCILLPDSLSFVDAAGMPETIFTVWHNVFQRGRLQHGETLLVHGGSGGIGSTAIQLAKCWGARVVTTIGSAEKRDFVLALGADVAINYKEEDFETALEAEKVDVILDSIGGHYFAGNIRILREEGRLLIINAMAGATVSLNLMQVMQKRIHITGSTLRNRSLEFKAALAQEIVQHVMPLLQSGLYKTPIHKVFSFDDVVQAHTMMDSRDFTGKLILKFL